MLFRIMPVFHVVNVAVPVCSQAVLLNRSVDRVEMYVIWIPFNTDVCVNDLAERVQIFGFDIQA